MGAKLEAYIEAVWEAALRLGHRLRLSEDVIRQYYDKGISPEACADDLIYNTANI
jgi:hypothetical protein